MRRGAGSAIVASVAMLVAACGSGGRGELTVSAATSLRDAFTAYGRTFGAADVRFSFAGSDQLAAQIRSGARPDVFAAADTSLPQALFAAGLLERPVQFASNRLVIAVPAGGSKVRGLTDLGRRGVAVATGTRSVPVGSYAAQVLDRLPASLRRRILANVRSSEPDVAGIVGKLTQGAADAGFVYLTDVRAAAGRLRAIRLPARLAPRVAYAAGVVRGSGRRAAAVRFVRGLVSGAGRRRLRAAGFGPPPGQ